MSEHNAEGAGTPIPIVQARHMRYPVAAGRTAPSAFLLFGEVQ